MSVSVPFWLNYNNDYNQDGGNKHIHFPKESGYNSDYNPFYAEFAKSKETNFLLTLPNFRPHYESKARFAAPN